MLEQITLIMVTLHIAGFLLSKALGYRSTVLACGIFGFTGSKPPDLNKIKILGLYNEDRGKDSCGIFVQDFILKGHGTNKLFHDFIETTIIPAPQSNFTVLGHTRAGTGGIANEKNAHPFLINNVLVGVHNGKITNIWGLCSKHGLKFSDFDVDSDAFYHILEKVGFSILNEYEGYAALAFTRLDDPNSLYLYHGKGKKFATGEMIEERPLFIMKTTEGIYFSSLAEALLAIRDKEEQYPEELEHNILFKLKSGRFTKSKLKVDRENVNVTTSTFYNSDTNARVGKSSRTLNQNRLNPPHWELPNTTRNSSNTATTNNGVREYENVIFRETLPVRAFDKNKVYWHFGRYWGPRRTLCHGLMYLDTKGIICKDDEIGGKAYYFYNGVLLTDMEAYNALIRIDRDPAGFMRQPSNNFAYQIAKFSQYPVCNMRGEASAITDSYFRASWYIGKLRAHGPYSPRFCSRNYRFVDGILQDITSSHAEDRPAMSATTREAAEQVQQLILGTLTPRAAEGGAVPEQDTFHTQGKATNFYDITFLTDKEAFSTLSTKNMEVLRRYAKEYMIGSNPLHPDDTEINTFVMEMVTNAVKMRCGIIDICETEEDKKLLRTMNQIIMIETKAAEKHVQDTIDTIDAEFMEDASDPKVVKEYQQEAQRVLFDEAVETDEEELETKGPFPSLPQQAIYEEWERNNSEEHSERRVEDLDTESLSEYDDAQIQDILDQSLSTMDNLQKLADELQAIAPDMAQQLAFHLYRTLDELRSDIRTVAEQFKHDEILELIEKNLQQQTPTV
jgi:predicted glutamine amidotransferase